LVDGKQKKRNPPGEGKHLGEKNQRGKAGKDGPRSGGVGWGGRSKGQVVLPTRVKGVLTCLTERRRSVIIPLRWRKDEKEFVSAKRLSENLGKRQKPKHMSFQNNGPPGYIKKEKPPSYVLGGGVSTGADCPRLGRDRLGH